MFFGGLRCWACLAGVALVGGAALGCGGSPYDKRWVADELSKKVGHEVRDLEAPRPADGARRGEGRERFRPSLPPGVADPASLTEDQAVGVALWNSAPFRADLAQLGFTRADLADAQALPNPSLAFLFPIGTRQMELSATYPISSLIQRPWRVAAAKLDVERTARGLVQSGLDLVRDVRIAWAEAAAAEERKRLRARIDELAKKGAGIARDRLVAGDVSALEADLVHAEALTQADASARSIHEADLARARLRLILGLADSELGARVGIRAPAVALREGSRAMPPALERLEAVALGARPDLRASELAIEAAGERLGLERSRIVQLVARLDGKPSGPGGGPPLLGVPGVQADLPILNQNPGGTGRAHAELDRAAWLYTVTRQQIVTDVRLAREELVMALASSAPYANTLVPLLERNVASALGAYETGAEPYLVVLEAMRRLGDARLRDLELGLDVLRARARLDRAVGWRIDAK